MLITRRIKPLRIHLRHAGSNIRKPVDDFVDWKPPTFTNLPDLPAPPPLSEWRKLFPHHKDISGRNIISDFSTGLTLADAFVPEGSKDVTIVEANPGPGILTRALLSLPKERVRKLILLEDHPPFLEALQSLAETDPRVEVVPIPFWQWDAYQKIDHLLPPPHEWSNGVHPKFRFICNLAVNVRGEQFTAQITRCIPPANWLFKLGRIPINLIIDFKQWQRHFGPMGSPHRNKVSIVTEMTTASQMAVPMHVLQSPDNSIFFNSKKSWKPEQIVALTLIPLEEQRIGKAEMAIWDYVLRRLFVTKSVPLHKSIQQLAVGAGVLLAKIEGKVDTKKKIKDLTLDDFAEIVRAFQDWPFAPTDLGVSDSFSEK